jgi:hypothetical protein
MKGELRATSLQVQRWLALTLTCLLAGCATSKNYDPRLNGTWRSNRDETVAAAFTRSPAWTNASPEKVERFKNIFGHMTITYSNGVAKCQDQGKQWSLKYRAVEKGQDYVVIRTEGGGIADQNNIRIQFVDDGNGYWTDSGKFLGLDTPVEKFDRVTELDRAANRSQPVHPETNQTSAPPASPR